MPVHMAGIGAVLSQVQEGQERVISYFSGVLSRAYCTTTRKELLIVVKAIQHFRPYFYGVSFLIRTDHAALKWLLNYYSPEGQIAHLIEQLQEYNFTIQHHTGRKHHNADALAKRPCLSDGCEQLENKEDEEFPVMCHVSKQQQWLAVEPGNIETRTVE